MGKKMPLLTTGYAGHDPESFLNKLREHEVEVVVDVRQNPISRKKGFSRSALSAFLSANNVEYVHEAGLGVPAHLRKQLKDGEQELAGYFDDFRKYLNECDAALERVYLLASTKRCCLLCVEHLPEECHRSVVAEAVEIRNGRKLKALHI